MDNKFKKNLFSGSESPVFGHEAGAVGGRLAALELPNEISAPYEVPQFPIEQIEKKLLVQRQLAVKLVSFFIRILFIFLFTL